MQNLLHALSDALSSAVARAAILGAIAAVAILIGIGGVAALFVALYFVLAEHFSRAEAALITALVAFGVCALIFVVMRMRSGGARKRADAPPAPMPDDTDSVDSTLATAMQVGSSIRRMIQDNKADAALGAFVVGLICGASPGTRRRISELARALLRREKKEAEPQERP